MAPYLGRIWTYRVHYERFSGSVYCIFLPPLPGFAWRKEPIWGRYFAYVVSCTLFTIAIYFKQFVAQLEEIPVC